MSDLIERLRRVADDATLIAVPCAGEAADRIEALEAALDLAVNIIMVNEPGDSRAVSDEAVALAAVSCGDTSPEVMAVIRDALASEQDK